MKVTVMIVGAVCLLSSQGDLYGESQLIESSQGCPRLPKRNSTGKIGAIYVGKALHEAGIVCVRIVCGNNISLGQDQLPWLERWEQEERTFRRFPPLSGGHLRHPWILFCRREGKFDTRLPSPYQPVPAGKYRACFHFTPLGQSEQEACSEEFSLP